MLTRTGVDGTVVPAPAAVEPDRPEEAAAASRTRSRSWRALTRGRGLVGLVLLGLVVLAGLLAPVLSPWDPLQQVPGANLLRPGGDHLLGTDQVNRDVWSRTLHGIRADLVVLAVGVPLGALAGSLLALLGTLSGVVDVAVQRLFDLLLSFPTLVFAIALTAVIGPGTWTVVTVIAVLETPVFGRVLRSAVLTVTAQPYVEASVAMGAPRRWVLRRHVLPNARDPLAVQLALSLSLAVFVEGAMSFLGIGVRPPAPSLGSLISDGIGYAESNVAYVVAPLVVVVVVVLGLQLVAQALGRAARGVR
nr:ABC transporter permease [Auraticoccus cholistanensis]